MKFRDQIFEKPTEKLKLQSESEPRPETLAVSPTPVKPIDLSESTPIPHKSLEEETTNISNEASRPNLPPRTSYTDVGFAPNPSLPTEEIPRDFAQISEEIPLQEPSTIKADVEEAVW